MWTLSYSGCCIWYNISMVRYSPNERAKAVLLRKQGLSYRQILEQVPVAKSTLSLWLAAVQLSMPQKQRLTQKRIEAALRGAASKRRIRMETTEKIYQEARGQIGNLSQRELWLIGVALYWAEGSKQRGSYVGSGVIFSNSDVDMARFFKEWLCTAIKLHLTQIKFQIYIHENNKHRLDEVKHYWAKGLRIPVSYLDTVYFKKNKISTTRKKTGNEYYGQIRIVVRSSANLNRTIAGWVQGIVKNCRFV